jgi:hypothetical protein
VSMKRIFNFPYSMLSVMLMLGITSSLQAQFPPKDEDQMIRQKVVLTIPLNEKMNQPLIFRELLQYTPNPTRYPERNGIVESLLMGLKLAKYTGFHGDSLDWSNTTFTWSELLAKHQKLNDIGVGDDEVGDSEGESGFEDFGGEEGGDEFGEEGAAEDAIAGDTYTGNRLGIDIGPYTDKMEIIEDRIFDKKRSDMYYDVKWIRLVWVDPGGVRPAESFIAFKYLDVMNQLDETQWKNRYNDAEYRSMREVVELRMYHSFIIDVSGNESVLTLNDAEYRRNQLVEYEHHLWHY